MRLLRWLFCYDLRNGYMPIHCRSDGFNLRRWFGNNWSRWLRHSVDPIIGIIHDNRYRNRIYYGNSHSKFNMRRYLWNLPVEHFV